MVREGESQTEALVLPEGQATPTLGPETLGKDKQESEPREAIPVDMWHDGIKEIPIFRKIGKNRYTSKGFRNLVEVLVRKCKRVTKASGKSWVASVDPCLARSLVPSRHLTRSCCCSAHHPDTCHPGQALQDRRKQYYSFHRCFTKTSFTNN